MFGTSYVVPLPKYPIKWPEIGDLISYKHSNGSYYSFIVLDFSRKTLKIELALYQGTIVATNKTKLVFDYHDLTTMNIPILETAVTLYGK